MLMFGFFEFGFLDFVVQVGYDIVSSVKFVGQFVFFVYCVDGFVQIIGLQCLFVVRWVELFMQLCVSFQVCDQCCVVFEVVYWLFFCWLMKWSFLLFFSVYYINWMRLIYLMKCMVLFGNCIIYFYDCVGQMLNVIGLFCSLVIWYFCF